MCYCRADCYSGSFDHYIEVGGRSQGGLTYSDLTLFFYRFLMISRSQIFVFFSSPIFISILFTSSFVLFGVGVTFLYPLLATLVSRYVTAYKIPIYSVLDISIPFCVLVVRGRFSQGTSHHTFMQGSGTAGAFGVYITLFPTPT